jgi:polar amino acid transport system permease protein
MMENMVLAILIGAPYTLALIAASFAIGVVLGLPICAIRQGKSVVLRFLMTALILTFRAIPPIVWLFFIFFGIGTGYVPMSPFTAACIGLGLITAVNMAEIYRGALTAIHSGQWEASKALGLPLKSMLLEIIGPQLVRISIPAAATYAIGLLKDSAIASVIGVQELAFQGHRVSVQTFRGLDVYAIVAVTYIAMSLPIAWLSRTIDLRMRARVAR